MRTTVGVLACAAAAVLLAGCASRTDTGSAAAGSESATAGSGSAAGGSGSTAVGGSAVAGGGSAAAGGSRAANGGSAVSGAASSASPAGSVDASAGTVVTVASSPYGPVLFDGSGQAIYTFDAEKTGEPACYGDCASAWPPVLTSGRPVARNGAEAGLLGITSRRDGSTQVTYRGNPLYFYAHEGKHVVLCHNVREFGGLWLAVTTAGTPAPT